MTPALGQPRAGFHTVCLNYAHIGVGLNGSYRIWSPVSERAVVEPQLIPAIVMPRAMLLKSQSLLTD